MKHKAELIKEAKGYFKSYKDDEIYTIGDGNWFLPSNLSAAKTHAAQNKKKLITITRAECEDTEATAKDNEVKIPEGEPSKEWTKDQLIAYGKREYPDLKLTKSSKEDTLLSKLEDAKKASEEAAQ